MPKLDWRGLVAGMSSVQKLVHLAARQDPYDEEAWRVELLRARRRAYEDELTIQARNSGCPGRRGRLGNNEILSGLNDESKADSVSIANTFNYYLANAIIRIRQETPTANRYIYAKRLREWEPGYWGWKRPQIDEWTNSTARTKAQQDFFKYNGAGMGSARLEPRTAVCPVCKGWVARGLVPLRVAMNEPPPYHPNCFPPGQKVLLPNGREMNIECVKTGDSVFSPAGQEGVTEVENVFCRHTQEVLYHIYANNRVLRVTGDHPVRGGMGWLPARELKVGDLIRIAHPVPSSSLYYDMVRSVKVEEYEGDVFNLKTGTGEYVVCSILVHNCPHEWNAKPDKAGDCSLLWVGD